jgi:hypothetical protein
LLDAYARRALFLMNESPMPEPEVFALAAALDRLRRRRPRWWLRVDEQSRWAARRADRARS